MSVDDRLFQVVVELTEPTPDGIQDAGGNIYTSAEYLKQESSKGNVPCSRDQVGDAIDRLIESGRLFSWHGLLAPVTDEHLTAIIENEREAEISRTLLIGNVNRILEAQ